MQKEEGEKRKRRKWRKEAEGEGRNKINEGGNEVTPPPNFSFYHSNDFQILPIFLTVEYIGEYFVSVSIRR